ncbi:AAA family ATPase [Pyrobaculum islandicum]|uniref:AAA family ATPase n=1 Tax=Pyrobaculum islandicum TaxID=2277 RepID=UPI001FD7C247|nr:AAA family ATPase [Pyrobaculum islandicum]
MVVGVLRGFVSLLLVSGKNVLFVGAPGVGKTRLALESAGFMTGCGPVLVVGRDGLSFEDLVVRFERAGGGLRRVFGGFGCAVLRSWVSLLRGVGPCHVVFDELNRANVDLIFGDLFTALDLAYRYRVPVVKAHELEDRAAVEECVGGVGDVVDRLRELAGRLGGLPLPYSFRLFATMNVVDRAQLFKLSFALLRRFAYLYVLPFYEDYEPSLREISPKEGGVFAKKLDEALDRFVDRAIEELSPSDAVEGDIATLVKLNFSDRAGIKEEVRGLWSKLGLGGLLAWTLGVAKDLGLELGPSVLTDLARLLVVYVSLRHLLSDLREEALADLAYSSLVLSQFSSAVPKLRFRALLSFNDKSRALFADFARRVQEIFGKASISYKIADALLQELPE